MRGGSLRDDMSTNMDIIKYNIKIWIVYVRFLCHLIACCKSKTENQTSIRCRKWAKYSIISKCHALRSTGSKSTLVSKVNGNFILLDQFKRKKKNRREKREVFKIFDGLSLMLNVNYGV